MQYKWATWKTTHSTALPPISPRMSTQQICTQTTIMLEGQAGHPSWIHNMPVGVISVVMRGSPLGTNIQGQWRTVLFWAVRILSSWAPPVWVLTGPIKEPSTIPQLGTPRTQPLPHRPIFTPQNLTGITKHKKHTNATHNTHRNNIYTHPEYPGQVDLQTLISKSKHISKLTNMKRDFASRIFKLIWKWRLIKAEITS